MNNRQKELLRILLTGSSDFFHVQELSNELGCSEKTVRSDLNRIETFLKEYPAVELIRKRGTGIHLSIHHADRVKLFHHIYQTGKIAAGHERVLEVAYQLLTSDNPLTLASLAESYFTNPTSMKHELNRIAHWLEGYHLTLMSKQRLGHIVKGRELDKRNALANLSELIPSENREKDRILQLFPQNETATVRKLLRGLQVDYPIDLTEGEFESLLIHVLIMIKRTRQRSSIVLGEMDAGANVKLETYHMTAWFLKRLGDALGVSFPENEYVYFTWHLESCRKKNGLTNLKADDLLADVVRQMTLQLQHMTMIRFREDKVLGRWSCYASCVSLASHQVWSYN
ncbi:M protein trans-acting positive regulator (MGA) HTH domain-containing protein [Lentibacillus halodurans]|uniref:M protein trans-acting positive regulator (MGA) HTH domain-containing protein n=1 Tax=Lentibacillus halodurans TaxID=237679 RepID=A0A1I0YCA3_9BACI|nr:HTH domain-containing protein [Lentibacillus halodurans]SFB10954.1 M protein trans-acting positive regulator (MGA) HTH domain-containing protein [Lentibacillus halodurans]